MHCCSYRCKTDTGKRSVDRLHTWGQKRKPPLMPFRGLKKSKRGAGEILLTSMDRDGTKDGYDLKLTRTLSDAVEVPVIASGGVGEPKHMAAGILEGHASAVLAASIFHFGEYSINETKKMMQEQGVAVRL